MEKVQIEIKSILDRIGNRLMTNKVLIQINVRKAR